MGLVSERAPESDVKLSSEGRGGSRLHVPELNPVISIQANVRGGNFDAGSLPIGVILGNNADRDRTLCIGFRFRFSAVSQSSRYRQLEHAASSFDNDVSPTLAWIWVASVIDGRLIAETKTRAATSNIFRFMIPSVYRIGRATSPELTPQRKQPSHHRLFLRLGFFAKF